MIPERQRNQAIEYAGVFFGIGGLFFAFFLKGTSSLAPTAPNIAWIFAWYTLFCIGGIALLTALSGDKNAKSFLAYFESERGVRESTARTVAKTLVALSVIVLLAVAGTK